MYGFSGTLAECFDKLRTADRSCINSFIEFVEAHPHTVAGWLFDIAKPPAGEFLVRAMLYFELAGWRVGEFADIDEVALGIAKLWMYKILPIDDIKLEIGSTSGANTGILEYIYGKRQPTLSSRRLAGLLIEKYQAQIEQREHELRQTLSLPTTSDEVLEGDLVGQVATLITKLSPLATRLLSDEFTDEDRERMRRLVGLEAYVELAVTLSAMKSLTTRAASRKGIVR